MNYIFYKRGRTAQTGRLLTRELSIRSNRSLERGLQQPSNVRRLIRWGESNSEYEQQLNNTTHVLNGAPAISLAANKLRALEALQSADIRIPFFTTDKEIAIDHMADNEVEMIGRTSSHQGGSGFTLCRNAYNIGRDNTSSHWMEKIDIQEEYRVHVFRGEVIGISKKTDQDVEDRITNRDARNHENGWRFVLLDIEQAQPRLKQIAIDAVAALGLDFGAVDIVLSTRPRRYYVLEVNTAACLEEGSTILANYITKFREWLESPTSREAVDVIANTDVEEVQEEIMEDVRPEPDRTSMSFNLRVSTEHGSDLTRQQIEEMLNSILEDELMATGVTLESCE